MVKYSCHPRVSETEAGAAGFKASSATLGIKGCPGLQETLSKSSISQNNGFCIFFVYGGGGDDSLSPGLIYVTEKLNQNVWGSVAQWSFPWMEFDLSARNTKSCLQRTTWPSAKGHVADYWDISADKEAIEAVWKQCEIK